MGGSWASVVQASGFPGTASGQSGAHVGPSTPQPLLCCRHRSRLLLKSLCTGCQEARGQTCGKWESHSEYPYSPPEILFGTRQSIFLVWFFPKGCLVPISETRGSLLHDDAAPVRSSRRQRPCWVPGGGTELSRTRMGSSDLLAPGSRLRHVAGPLQLPVARLLLVGAEGRLESPCGDTTAGGPLEAPTQG